MGTKLAGIVLAGGKSRRFGNDKALYMFNNRTFLDHALYHLKAVSYVTAVIGRANHRNEASLFLEDEEVYREKGPLAGLYTAMKEVQAEWYPSYCLRYASGRSRDSHSITFKSKTKIMKLSSFMG
ncbi:NTP transferase domain-containing protein [Metabacillus idriensis]|uniref:NTP transferase domain-containing protein n=1 Tax=Metabacillus idriensis TaxID=324768 RepID=UPI00174A52D4|nr:NTP transferase domain-containing protein [Metabacillus idriensis]